MGDTEVRILRRWFQEVWNERRPGTIVELMHPQAAAHSATGDMVGPTAWKAQFWDPFMAAFSDIRVTLDAILSQGNEVAVRWTVSLKHTGPLMGVPASGKTVQAKGMSVVRVENGQITEGWDAWDVTGLLVDIGAPLDALKQSRPRT